MVRDVERGPYSEEETLGSFLASGWRAQDLVLDPWSGLSHKQIIGPGGKRGAPQPSLAPSWVGKHSRRLNAYRVLLAYLSNVSRAFLPNGRPLDEVEKFREYGDAATLRDMIRTSVLGEEPEIVVDGADERPEKPDEPTDPGEGASDGEKTAFVEEKKLYDEALKDFERDVEEYDRAQSLQKWFDSWADAEKFPLKNVDVENDAAGLGDGVYYVSWSNRKRRVKLACYDPGFYFPALATGDDYDYPTRVHLAWEEDDDEKPSIRYVRRITFELRETTDARSYPWHEDGDPESYVECVMSDGKWRFDDLGDRHVDTLSVDRAEWAANEDGVELFEYPLGIDFVPVVHVPNTITKHHFGESVVTRIAQILDDVGQTDTDLAVAADLAGAPPIAAKGTARPASGALTSYGPGTVFFGDGFDVLDTSRSLDALLKRLDSLLDRLSVNGRVPKEVLGRVKMSDVPSGVALLLTFGPFRALIREMRLVRADKYRLLFSFVQRLAMVGAASTNGQAIEGRTLTPGPLTKVELKFGSYLPTDMKQVADMVLALLTAKGISRASALSLLRDAGLDLDDDLAKELARIEHEDFAGAKELADATGEEKLAAEYLGRSMPEPKVAAPGTLPGAPGAPGAPPTPPAPGPANPQPGSTGAQGGAPGTPPGAPPGAGPSSN